MVNSKVIPNITNLRFLFKAGLHSLFLGGR